MSTVYCDSDDSGVFRHARCDSVLVYQRPNPLSGQEFYCNTCKESVFLPDQMHARIPVRSRA